MRKIDPAGVLDDFEAQLEDQSQFYQQTWEALPNAANRKVASENYALAIGVMFEGFVNDLILAYANRNCSRVMQHLKSSLEEHLKSNSKAKATFEHFGEVRERKHLNVSELKEILDPEGRNTSFSDYSAIRKRASQWLSEDHLENFTQLGARDQAVVNVVIAVRNNLAHRSKGSLDRLNEVLSAGPLHDTGLQRQVNRVQQAGNYLKSYTGQNFTRADVLGEYLGNIARQLAGQEIAE